MGIGSRGSVAEGRGMKIRADRFLDRNPRFKRAVLVVEISNNAPKSPSIVRISNLIGIFSAIRHVLANVVLLMALTFKSAPCKLLS